MSSILHSVPDVNAIVANIGVFLGAITAAVLGSMKAVKVIKKSIVEALAPEDGPTVTHTQVIGGILQDQYGSAMMAEQLRTNASVNEELKDAVCEMTREMREMRHMMDRVMDRMPINGR